MIHRVLNKFSKPAIISLTILFGFSTAVLAGSLTPPGIVASTMHSLQELYDSIAGTFDSTAIVANENGSLMENLKFIEDNMGSGSGGSVSSDSLDFDEFVDSMNLDANTTVASHGFTFSLMGNVGIGVANPEVRLGVDGDIWLTNTANRTIAMIGAPDCPVCVVPNGFNLTIKAGDSGDSDAGVSGNLILAAGTGGATGGSVFIYGASTNGGNVVLGHDGTAAIGNVGIGTINPTAKLAVAGTASISGVLYANGGCVGCGTGGAVASDSLDFDEFVDNMTLDANTSITNNGFALTFGEASVSSDFEVSGLSSISGWHFAKAITNAAGNLVPGAHLGYIDGIFPSAITSTKNAIQLRVTSPATTATGQTRVFAATYQSSGTASSSAATTAILGDNKVPVYGASSLAGGSARGVWGLYSGSGTASVSIGGYLHNTGGGLNAYGGAGFCQAGTSCVGLVGVSAGGTNRAGGYFGLETVGLPVITTAAAIFNNAAMAAPIALFLDNGVEVVRIADGGNVGIGTTNVSSKLEVAGTASVSGTTTLNGVTYTWPTTQGGVDTFLKNNGSGGLTWDTPAGGGGASAGGLDVVVPAFMMPLANTQMYAGAANEARMFIFRLSAPMQLERLKVLVTTGGSGVHEWGLFDVSTNSLAATKLAGGSGTLNGAAGWQGIDAAGAPVSVGAGTYLLIFKWPATNPATIGYSLGDAGSAWSKAITPWVWDDTPDVVTGWTTGLTIFHMMLVGNHDNAGTADWWP